LDLLVAWSELVGQVVVVLAVGLAGLEISPLRLVRLTMAAAAVAGVVLVARALGVPALLSSVTQ
jgi:hypothetical protein